MRILVCGGRQYTDAVRLVQVLDALHKKTPVAVVIHGDAYGADRLADLWASVNDVPVQPYPADWDRYGNAAGPIRNRQMLVDGRPDLVVAFPGKHGTDHMVSIAKKAGVEVQVVE
jgi:hypothetical protein